MNNIYKLIFILTFIVLGCKPIEIRENKLIQRIDSLDLNIYSNEGSKIYSINSPNSSYNLEKNTFELKKTTINIFKEKKTKYIINSDESILSNNNKIVELTGNVVLRTIQKDNDILYANSFIWNIDNTNYLLTGDVKFENKNIILSSDKATLNSNNIIEFFNPVKYIIKNNNNEKSYEVNSENAFYNIDSNTVSFSSKEKRVRSKIYF